MRGTGLQVRFSIFLLGIFLLASLAARAQNTTDEEENRPVASRYGNTGYWHVFNADSFAQGQAGFNVFYDRINRNPGFLTISSTGVSGAVGITNWLEFGASFDINEHILVRRQDQLSFGQQALGLYGNFTRGATPLPNQLVPGSSLIPQLRFPATRTGVFNGTAGYYNNLPFIGGTREASGVGPVNVGLKLSILSESRGDPFGFAIRGYVVIPTKRAVNVALSDPKQTGEWQYGSDVILSKNLGDLAQMSFNAGFRGISSPADGRYLVLSDEVPLGFGFVVPRKTRIQLMGEVTADVFVGAHTRQTTFDARDPMDATIGFRAFLGKAVSLSGGYRHTLNQFGGDKNGFIADLSYSSPPPKHIPPSPPSLTCSADPADVLAGQQVTLTAQGTSSTGATLTYSWSTTSGTLEGTGATVHLRTDGLAAGAYTATVRASEGPGLFADCTARFTVRTPPPPARPPTVSLLADRTRVQSGEIINLTARGVSPDNRPLTYAWRSTGGRVEGTGAVTRFDTTGLAPGNYTVGVRAIDDRTLSSDEATVNLTVVAPPPPPPPPPPPQVSDLGSCSFKAASPRVDNVCKAKLDDAALRMRNEADSTLVIVGFAASNERGAARLAETRARNARTYLTREKGIAESRIEVRTGPAAPGAAQRKVEIHFVPRGATFTGGNVVPERTSPAAASKPAGARRATKKKAAQGIHAKPGSERTVIARAR